jgi:hypothetical protein
MINLLTLPSDMNQSGGLEQILIYVVNNIPLLPNLILFFIFLIISIGGYSIESKRREGANILVWFAIASYMVSVLSLVLFLTDGIINLYVVVLTIVLSIIFTAVLFLSDTIFD